MKPKRIIIIARGVGRLTITKNQATYKPINGQNVILEDFTQYYLTPRGVIHKRNLFQFYKFVPIRINKTKMRVVNRYNLWNLIQRSKYDKATL